MLDGFKRLRAARSLGWRSLEVSEISAPAHGPWALMLSLNRTSGMTVVEEALLLAEMSRSGLRQSEIAQLVGRHLCRARHKCLHAASRVMPLSWLGRPPLAQFHSVCCSRAAA